MSPATRERDKGWHWPSWALGLTARALLTRSASHLELEVPLLPQPKSVGNPDFILPTTPQPQRDTLELLTCEHAPDDSTHACEEVREGPGRGVEDQQAPLLPPGLLPSLSPPSPVLLCQLHHHGRELVEHEHSRKPLVAQQPIGDLLMSGHRELICPQHLGWEGN